MAKGTGTFHIIQYRDVPVYRLKDVTYTKVFCKLKHNKEDKNRMRIIAGGNHIIYPGDVGKKTGSLETVKLVSNSVISYPGA